MATIVTVTDFVGEIYIPNADKAYVAENIQRFIDKYEKDFLLRVFGTGLYNDLMTGLETVPVPEKWDKLINGDSIPVEFHGIEVYYGGIKQAIANYVYYWLARDRSSQTIDMGEASPTVENAVVVTNSNKTVRAWNEMSDMVRDARLYVSSKPLVYPYTFPFYAHWHGWYNWNLNGWCTGYYLGRRRTYDYFAKINVNNI